MRNGMLRWALANVAKRSVIRKHPIGTVRRRFIMLEL